MTRIVNLPRVTTVTDLGRLTETVKVVFTLALPTIAQCAQTPPRLPPVVGASTVFTHIVGAYPPKGVGCADVLLQALRYVALAQVGNLVIITHKMPGFGYTATVSVRISHHLRQHLSVCSDV